MKTNSELKNRAIDALTGNWGLGAVITLVYGLVMNAPTLPYRIMESVASSSFSLIALLLLPLGFGYTVLFLDVIHEDEMSLLMMINRIQTPQDFTDFLRSNQDEIREIMERASENIVQIIVNSLWALFMKMQVSVSEATDCLRKMIGGESMGNWFENMEPMNIQEERAKTKKAEEELEESVKAMFKLLKKLCPTKEQAVQELIESYDKTEEEAQKLVEQYW
jgi:hypothetical protein